MKLFLLLYTLCFTSNNKMYIQTTDEKFYNFQLINNKCLENTKISYSDSISYFLIYDLSCEDSSLIVFK